MQSTMKGSKFSDSFSRHLPEKLGEPGGEAERVFSGDPGTGTDSSADIFSVLLDSLF